MDCTKKAAEFVAGSTFEAIPAPGVESAKTAIIDSVGVALAGSQEKSARIAALLARGEGAKEESTLIGQGFRSSALLAALANGTAGHALDYDYSYIQMGQPMAGLVAATFSLGEALGASGREILAAYVAGYEVTARLVAALAPRMNQSSWHSAATVGSIGTTAASARLLGLNPEAVGMALGIAASMASGIVANFATMTKPLHAGLAAKNGVLAARLARAGFTSNGAILERGKGFLQAFGGGPPVDEAGFATLGRKFALVDGIRIKPYPCGGLTHSAVDALLALRARHGLTPAAVARIEVGVTQRTYENIVYDKPQNGLQGKFSMPYILARALVHGKLTLDHFTDEAVGDSSIRDLGEKIAMTHNPAFEDGVDRRPSEVTVRLKEGRTLSHRVDCPKGGPESPMTAAEIREKFSQCAGRALGKEEVARALELLENLEQLGDPAPLFRLLLGGDRQGG